MNLGDHVVYPLLSARIYYYGIPVKLFLTSKCFLEGRFSPLMSLSTQSFIVEHILVLGNFS